MADYQVSTLVVQALEAEHGAQTSTLFALMSDDNIGQRGYPAKLKEAGDRAGVVKAVSTWGNYVNAALSALGHLTEQPKDAAELGNILSEAGYTSAPDDVVKWANGEPSIAADRKANKEKKDALIVAAAAKKEQQKIDAAVKLHQEKIDALKGIVKVAEETNKVDTDTLTHDELVKVDSPPTNQAPKPAPAPDIPLLTVKVTSRGEFKMEAHNATDGDLLTILAMIQAELELRNPAPVKVKSKSKKQAA